RARVRPVRLRVVRLLRAPHRRAPRQRPVLPALAARHLTSTRARPGSTAPGGGTLSEGLREPPEAPRLMATVGRRYAAADGRHSRDPRHRPDGGGAAGRPP